MYYPKIRVFDMWLHICHLQSWLPFDFCPVGIDKIEVTLWDHGVLPLLIQAPDWLSLTIWSSEV